MSRQSIEVIAGDSGAMPLLTPGKGALYDARNWCASVFQSHASHPSLIYFRSVGTGPGWPAALGALMDVALIFELLIDDPGSRAAAVLLQKEGLRLVKEIAILLGLQPREATTGGPEVDKLRARLYAAGYGLKPKPDMQAFAKRMEYASCIEAIAEPLGTPTAPLIS